MSMKRDLLKRCFTPDPDFKGWKRDLLNGILIWVIYEGARRIQKICKRFKLQGDISNYLNLV